MLTLKRRPSILMIEFTLAFSSRVLSRGMKLKFVPFSVNTLWSVISSSVTESCKAVSTTAVAGVAWPVS